MKTSQGSNPPSTTSPTPDSSGAVVPRSVLTREILADLDTPVSTYLKVANQTNTYLFESVTGGDKWGRYSIIGLPCRESVCVHGRRVSRLIDGAVVEELTVADPLHWIEQFHAQFFHNDYEGLPRFVGGLVGYFGYETIAYIEQKLGGVDKPDPLGTPDITLLVSNEVIVFDNLLGKLQIVIHVERGSESQGHARLDEIEKALRAPRPDSPPHTARELDAAAFTSSFGQNAFIAGVETIRDYITAGDCMQVVLAQRLSAPFSADALNLYRALRLMNPSPYMYYLNFGDYQIVGSSPEILVRLEDNEVTVRPIAGTRPRGADEAKDIELEQSLLADPKELAEHLMLIDLGRNDVGRIAQIGSVELTEKMLIERYSHVMHIVSNVRGQLKPGLNAMDVIRATFPAGTVSGAPKIRAMEIIDELEPIKRGIYSGAVGYLSWSGNLDTAIAIRTAVVKDGEVHVQAGAGVVYDSNPASEWDETLNKARAVIQAARLAEAGFESDAISAVTSNVRRGA
jgi:anthranilate synthase component 1